jgi:hypothetical protein
MKTAHDTPASHGITRRGGLLTLLGGAMALAGCGGGGGGSVATVGGGGTGSFSAGPVSGFGSIIVNGVRFDDSIARLLDDDGLLHVDHTELKLGMMVRVKGKANSRKADNTDSADEISFGSQLMGPIDSIPSPQTAPATLVVLGQTVQITASTIFEEGLTLSMLAKDTIVEVHGFVDPATNRLVATRIELKLPANVTTFKLQGTVSALDTTAKTFKIGGLTISFDSSVDIPANLILVNGLLVRVRLDSNPLTSTATRKATKIRAIEAEVEDRDEAEVEGMITDFTSSAKFSVNGQPVDASGATVPAGLKMGSRVEVQGSLVNGVLVAKKVQLKDENEKREFELHGIVSNATSNSITLTSTGGIVAKVTFTTGMVNFINGTVANLVNGVKVEVKGMASPDGTMIVATSIAFE